MSSDTTQRECLQCGQTKAQIRRDNTICGIEGGYEYRELEAEWSRHRWADWNDAELDRAGIRPEAYARHRRDNESALQYAACDDTKRGHIYPHLDDLEFGYRIDQCMKCGQHSDR